jgi:hypothetical protein
VAETAPVDELAEAGAETSVPVADIPAQPAESVTQPVATQTTAVQPEEHPAAVEPGAMPLVDVEVISPVAEIPVTVEIESAPAAAEPEAVTVVEVAPVQAAEVLPAETHVEKADKPVETAVPAEANPAPEAEPANLEEVLADSGLVMVQTTSPPQVVQPEAPAVPLGRPRRKSVADASTTDEPLMMVETKK